MNEHKRIRCLFQDLDVWPCHGGEGHWVSYIFCGHYGACYSHSAGVLYWRTSSRHLKDVLDGGSVIWGGCSKSRGFEMSSLFVVLFILDWLSRGLNNRGLKKCNSCRLFGTSKDHTLPKTSQTNWYWAVVVRGVDEDWSLPSNSSADYLCTGKIHTNKIRIKSVRYLDYNSKKRREGSSICFTRGVQNWLPLQYTNHLHCTSWKLYCHQDFHGQ